MRADKKSPLKAEKKTMARSHKRGVVGYSKKTALLEDAITQMNAGKYGRSSAALKELLALDPLNMEARRLFATLHLRLGSLIPARQAFESLINEAFERQDYWLAESLLREYLAAGPRCVPFLEKLGAVHQEKGDVLEAVAEYGKAIDILIEDPDTDNPQHASQLYAKIRDLAPASPVAFRLASFFDAQTGELIARPSVVHTEVAAPTSPVPNLEVEDFAGAVAIPEPLGGVMPWEQGIEDFPKVSFVSTAQHSPLPAEPPAASASEVTGIKVDESPTVPPPSVSPSALDQGGTLLDPGVEPIIGSTDLLQVDEPAQTSPAENITTPIPDILHEDSSSSRQSLDVPFSAAAVSFEDASATISEPETVQTITNDPILTQPPAIQESESPSSQFQGTAAAESISAPMPWEHVQESTISIPDHVPDVPPVPAARTEELSTATILVPEPPVVGQDDSHETASLPPSITEVSKNLSDAEEPRVEPPSSLPDAAPASSLPEVSKGGGFSWESVFNSAWKFGDKLSASTLAPVAPQAATAHIEESPTPPASSFEAPAVKTEFVEVARPSRGQSEPESVAPTLSVPAPMPWDHVQETVITIPPAPVDEIVAEIPAQDTIPSPNPVEPVLAALQEPALEQDKSEGVVSPTSAAPQLNSFSIMQPPPAPPSSEPEFRLVGIDPSPSVEVPRSNSMEAQPQPSASAEVSEPPQQIEIEIPTFRMADSRPAIEETSVAVQPIPPPALLKEEAVEPPQQSHEPASFIIAASVPEFTESAPRFRGKTIQPVSIAPPAPVSVSGIEAAQTPSHGDESAPHLKVEVGKLTSLSQPFVEEQLSHGVKTNASVGSLVVARSVEMPVAPEPPMESAQVPPLPTGDPSHWKTGEVAVQPHRPTSKKRKRAGGPTPEPVPTSPPVVERPRVEPAALHQEEAAVAPEEARRAEPVHEKEEWIRTGESIRFVEPQSPGVEKPASQASVQAEGRVAVPASTAAAAVDVLFNSSGRFTKTGTRECVAEPKPRPRFRTKLSRSRIAISVFISSCFSTTRAIVASFLALIVLSAALLALGIGAVGLTWIIMEEPPSPAFQSLTTLPQRTLSDSRKNGYLLLLGFDAPTGQDPMQAGYERKPDRSDADVAAACVDGLKGGPRTGQTNASANVANGWFHGSDPVGQFRSHQDTVRGWTSQGESVLGRYKQWLKLSFEDWGYGQSLSPSCASIMFAHQLYLADGFVQGTDMGVDRLETDMEAWRIALGQAKTLSVKTMALQAINDDIAVAASLLVRPDFDSKILGRVTKMLRPMDQVELSIRWPMQSELVSATKTFEAQLKAERGEDLPLYAAVASALPLPKQRRFNDYAKYYEASYKAAGEGRYGSMPKWSHYIHFPANTVVDYLSNPIENVVGLEPLAPWDLYNGLVVDTDAHLRLASLQAWLRRAPQDADLLARIAKAGQNFYDPYTGLPMLVNLKKGVMYSVGHDGKDQDADPQADVVVTIPVNQAPAVSARPSISKPK